MTSKRSSAGRVPGSSRTAPPPFGTATFPRLCVPRCRATTLGCAFFRFQTLPERTPHRHTGLLQPAAPVCMPGCSRAGSRAAWLGAAGLARPWSHRFQPEAQFLSDHINGIRKRKGQSRTDCLPYMEGLPLFGNIGGPCEFREVLCVVKVTGMGGILDRSQRTSGAIKGTGGGIPERRQILCEAVLEHEGGAPAADSLWSFPLIWV